MDVSFLPETNWVDVLVVIFLIRGGYIGLDRGFSVELFKVLAAITTCVLTLCYYTNLGEWLTSHSFLSLPVANVVSFLGIFCALLITFRAVRLFLFKILRLELFYGLERWGGFILGLSRSIVFASLFLFVLALLPAPYIKESVELNSFSGPYLQKIPSRVLDFVMQFKPKVEEK
jgi:membrane protein required for colicin V production